MKVTKGFGSFELTFKHYGYYQIKYSAYKNMSYSSTYRGYGSSFTYSGAGSGTKIYYKVREYTYSKSGKVLMGKWSKKKKVKVY